MAGRRTLAQDNYRETMMAEHCGLTLVPGRMHDDAIDVEGRVYELKSSTKSDKYFSTARDLTIARVRTEWSNKIWLASTGKEFTDGDQKRYIPTQIVVCHPKFLQAEFDRIIQPLIIRQQIVDYIKEKIQHDPILAGASKELSQLFKRGMTLNDPKMRMAPFLTFGAILDLHDKTKARSQMLEYVAKHDDISSTVETRSKFFQYQNDPRRKD